MIEINTSHNILQASLRISNLQQRKTRHESFKQCDKG